MKILSRNKNENKDFNKNADKPVKVQETDPAILVKKYNEDDLPEERLGDVMLFRPVVPTMGSYTMHEEIAGEIVPIVIDKGLITTKDRLIQNFLQVNKGFVTTSTADAQLKGKDIEIKNLSDKLKTVEAENIELKKIVSKYKNQIRE